mmetsp:Transcript_89387/g.289077  ORF Transcript_89387/g.289077 Transcript_89387/m.289077 type:complete len:421 (+) Transcript_89387:3005-4267(+)
MHDLGGQLAVGHHRVVHLQPIDARRGLEDQRLQHLADEDFAEPLGPRRHLRGDGDDREADLRSRWHLPFLRVDQNLNARFHLERDVPPECGQHVRVVPQMQLHAVCRRLEVRDGEVQMLRRKPQNRQLHLCEDLDALRVARVETDGLQQSAELPDLSGSEGNVHLQALAGPQHHASGAEDEAHRVIDASLQLGCRLHVLHAAPPGELELLPAARVQATTPGVHPRLGDGLLHVLFEDCVVASHRASSEALQKGVDNLLVREHWESAARVLLAVFFVVLPETRQHRQVARVVEAELDGVSGVRAHHPVVDETHTPQLHARCPEAGGDPHLDGRGSRGGPELGTDGEIHHDRGVKVCLSGSPQCHHQLHTCPGRDLSLVGLDGGCGDSTIACERGVMLWRQRHPLGNEPVRGRKKMSPVPSS